MRGGLAAVWLVAWVAGTLVIAWPDDSERLVSLSEGHGPAPLDAVGIGVVAIGTVACVVLLWLGRHGIPGRAWAAAVAVYVPGMALTAWSVATDGGAWWVLGVAASSAAMAWVGTLALRAGAPARAGGTRGG